MTRSATRLEVSTLPAATAAGKRALSRLPSGARTSIGRWAPAEGGASGSVSTRTAKKAADLVTESGQLRLPSTCGVGAAEVEPQALACDRRLDPQDGRRARRRRGRPRARPRPRRCRRAARRAPPACGARRSRGSPPSRRAACAEAVAVGQLGEARSPTRLAARWARRSASRCRGSRICAGQPRAARRRRRGSAGSRRPPPRGVFEKAGMPPGVGPPMSAWWARLAAKPSSSPSAKTGEIRVMSGRWVPPR